VNPKPPPSRAEIQAQLEEARKKYRKHSNAAALPNLTPQEAALARNLVRSAATEVILAQKARADLDKIDSENGTISGATQTSNPTNSERAATLRGSRRAIDPAAALKARFPALTAADPLKALKNLRAWVKVFENPFAWLLLALLAFAEYGNYQRGRELVRVCELLGPHGVSVVVPLRAREEIDNICIGRRPDQPA
jgi:hypothetical protein